MSIWVHTADAAAASNEAEIERLSRLFQGLGDPARLRILNLLAQGGEVRNTEVEAVTGYGASKVSRHFAYLKSAGLVRDRREGLSVYYALAPTVGVASSAVLDSLARWPAFYGLFRSDAQALVAERAARGAASPEAAERKPRVLFLCQHNAVRSQMAEALLKRHAGERMAVQSAGLSSSGIDPMTLRVLAEAGLSTRDLRSKAVTGVLTRGRFDFVITLCLEAEEACPRMFPGALQVINWPFEDVAAARLPKAERLERFRLLRDRIDHRIREWLKD